MQLIPFQHVISSVIKWNFKRLERIRANTGPQQSLLASVIGIATDKQRTCLCTAQHYTAHIPIWQKRT
jgi:hypothetical protein